MKLIPWILISLLGPPASALASDWPQWGGPGRDFVRPEGPTLARAWPKKGPHLLWRRELGFGHSGVVGAGNTAYTAFRSGNDDVIVALELASGREIWRHVDRAPAMDFQVPRYGDGPHATPLLVGNRLFFVGSTAHLIALDATTGKRLWRVRLWEDLDGTELERGYAASPLAVGDAIVLPVGGKGRGAVAFRQSDGSVLWSRHDFAAAYASPVLLRVDGIEQICMLFHEHVVGLDPKNGALLWKRFIDRTRYVHCTTPIVTGDGGIIVNTKAGVARLDVQQDDGRWTVSQRWITRRIGSQDHNMLRTGDLLLGSRSSRYFAGIDLPTGDLLFQEPAVHDDASIIHAGDMLLAVYESGELALSRPSREGVKLLAKARVLDGRCWGAPALVGTTLIVRDTEQIVAIDLTP